MPNALDLRKIVQVRLKNLSKKFLVYLYVHVPIVVTVVQWYYSLSFLYLFIRITDSFLLTNHFPAYPLYDGLEVLFLFLFF